MHIAKCNVTGQFNLFYASPVIPGDVGYYQYHVSKIWGWHSPVTDAGQDALGLSRLQPRSYCDQLIFLQLQPQQYPWIIYLSFHAISLQQTQDVSVFFAASLLNPLFQKHNGPELLPATYLLMCPSVCFWPHVLLLPASQSISLLNSIITATLSGDVPSFHL